MSGVICHTVRIVRQTCSDTDQIIEDLVQHLVSLQQSLNSGIALETNFVSTRTLTLVEKLSTWTALANHFFSSADMCKI